MDKYVFVAINCFSWVFMDFTCFSGKMENFDVICHR